MKRASRLFACGAVLAALLSLSPDAQAQAQDVPSSAAAASALETASLDPGDYLWHPELAPEGPVEIVVSLPMQTAWIYRAGTLIGVSTVSTGKPGHDTPTGRFEILQKKKEHVSNLYDAPMPYMQRLTWDGIALHAGAIPGQPASHGCVRLPLAFARKLFEATRLGALVHIVDQAPASPQEALTLASGGTAEWKDALPVELASGS
jgi:hypothetical protein